MFAEAISICFGAGVLFYLYLELLGIWGDSKVRPKTQEEWEQEQRERKKQHPYTVEWKEENMTNKERVAKWREEQKKSD